MLPASARVRRRDEFTLILRSGGRVGRGSVVVHLALPEVPETAPDTADASPAAPARVGFVVSKAVGNSVVRHRVVRRLRHVMAPRLASLPAGSMVVVRALPAAARRSSAALGHDIDAALPRLLGAAGNAARR